MHRNQIQLLLQNYNPIDLVETVFLEKMKYFVSNNSDCFERTNISGHVTGSAFIINHQQTHTLLVHHKKLNKWLQPGGHCDGDNNVANVAQKEAEEETGISNFKIENHQIFDIDIHEIPKRKGIAAHLHYDTRFLIIADDTQQLIVSDESNELKWVKLTEIENFNNEVSVLRMAKKILQ